MRIQQRDGQWIHMKVILTASHWKRNHGDSASALCNLQLLMNWGSCATIQNSIEDKPMRKAAISHGVYTQSPNHACIHRLAPNVHPQGCWTLSPPPYMSSAAAAIITIAKPELQQYLSVLLPLQEIANKTLSNQISSNFLYFSRRRSRREPHPSMSGGRKAHHLDIVATHTYVLDSSIPPSNLVFAGTRQNSLPCKRHLLSLRSSQKRSGSLVNRVTTTTSHGISNF